MKMQAPRGTVDLLPEETSKWQAVEKVLRDLSKSYNFGEIRTPLFEHTEVFARGVGDTTDIVQKEMYTFQDRGSRNITLRPEGTAGVVRSYVENKLYGSPIQPTKLFYFAQMFRYERPEKGRFRQLNQFGVEVLGSAEPGVDAEVIALAMAAYEKLGLKNIKLVLNTLGDNESRLAHRKALTNHFRPHIDELCSDCANRLEKNPLRILDCKRDMNHPVMKTAPSVLDYLNEESSEYFDRVKKYLNIMEIEYKVDPTLVRGLDYYNNTVFEIMSNAEGFGANTTLLGGGRYSGLVEQLGGPDTPGIGFGMGLERLMLALEEEKVALPVNDGLDLFFVTIGEPAQEKAIKLMKKMRYNGFKVDKDYADRKMKAQFKAAERLNAKKVAVIGDNELEKDVVAIRDLVTGKQNEVAIKELIEYIKEN